MKKYAANDVIKTLTNWVSDNPAAATAVIGGGLGALGGAAFTGDNGDPDESAGSRMRRRLKNALLLGAAGAGAGVLGTTAYNMISNPHTNRGFFGSIGSALSGLGLAAAPAAAGAAGGNWLQNRAIDKELGGKLKALGFDFGEQSPKSVIEGALSSEKGKSALSRKDILRIFGIDPSKVKGKDVSKAIIPQLEAFNIDYRNNPNLMAAAAEMRQGRTLGSVLKEVPFVGESLAKILPGSKATNEFLRKDFYHGSKYLPGINTRNLKGKGLGAAAVLAAPYIIDKIMND